MPRLFALDHNFPDPIVTSILNQGRELAALIQTKLTLVVAAESGHNPVKASGLMFAYLGGICGRTSPGTPQAWILSAANRPHREPWDLLKRYADHNARTTEDVWTEFKLSPQQLARDPLS